MSGLGWSSRYNLIKCPLILLPSSKTTITFNNPFSEKSDPASI